MMMSQLTPALHLVCAHLSETGSVLITRKLIGVSRSDASVAPTGVGGGLEAWITCWGLLKTSGSLIKNMSQNQNTLDLSLIID